MTTYTFNLGTGVFVVAGYTPLGFRVTLAYTHAPINKTRLQPPLTAARRDGPKLERVRPLPFVE